MKLRYFTQRSLIFYKGFLSQTMMIYNAGKRIGPELSLFTIFNGSRTFKHSFTVSICLNINFVLLVDSAYRWHIRKLIKKLK